MNNAPNLITKWNHSTIQNDIRSSFVIVIQTRLSHVVMEILVLLLMMRRSCRLNCCIWSIHGITISIVFNSKLFGVQLFIIMIKFHVFMLITGKIYDESLTYILMELNRARIGINKNSFLRIKMVAKMKINVNLYTVEENWDIIRHNLKQKSVHLWIIVNMNIAHIFIQKKKKERFNNINLYNFRKTEVVVLTHKWVFTNNILLITTNKN